MTPKEQLELSHELNDRMYAAANESRRRSPNKEYIFIFPQVKASGHVPPLHPSIPTPDLRDGRFYME